MESSHEHMNEESVDYLGAHMSIAGGVQLAPERGKAAGCGVIQIFTQNSNQWRGKAITDGEVALFRQHWSASSLHDIISHNIYLINLAAAEGSEVRQKSLVAFAEEMERCNRLGIDKIVMHPGSHLGDGEDEGISRIIAAFDQLFTEVPAFGGKILLETTAGQGTNIGCRFEHLRAIMDGSRHAKRFGVCFDTCHAFAAGYDITTPSGYDSVFADFDRIIGLERLLAFHINDSKKGLNSRVDRHEHIGRGAMGIEGFRLLMNDQRFATTPKILEPPKEGDAGEDMDRVNLTTLRGMVS